MTGISTLRFANAGWHAGQASIARLHECVGDSFIEPDEPRFASRRDLITAGVVEAYKIKLAKHIQLGKKSRQVGSHLPDSKAATAATKDD